MTVMQASNPKDVRKNREAGVLIQFPSGYVFKIRAVNPSDFLRAGKMPDPVSHIIQEVLSGRADKIDFSKQTLEEFQTYYAFLEFYARLCFVYPRIVDKAEADDEIQIEDLEQGDLEFLVGVIFAPLSALERFSEEQSRSLESVQSGKKHIQKAKPVPTGAAVGAG